jgi:hypothetical protein
MEEIPTLGIGTIEHNGTKQKHSIKSKQDPKKTE